jgi:hypothetical protein
MAQNNYMVGAGTCVVTVLSSNAFDMIVAMKS